MREYFVHWQDRDEGEIVVEDHGFAPAVPVPWCKTHDLPLMYDKDRCNRSPNPMRHNCRMPIEPQVFRIETDDE